MPIPFKSGARAVQCKLKISGPPCGTTMNHDTKCDGSKAHWQLSTNTNKHCKEKPCNQTVVKVIIHTWPIIRNKHIDDTYQRHSASPCD